MLAHGAIQESCRYTDIHGSLDLVTSEHPDLDASLLHELDGVCHLVLESILNGS